MALSAAPITTVANVSPNREDLKDSIWDVSPEEVPFTSGCSRMSANATTVEWQTDVLAAAADNFVAEGEEAAFSAATDTVRKSNQTQILAKTAKTSGTVDAVDKAGLAKQMAYQIVRRAKEIKRDFERACVGVNVIAAPGTTRKLASYTTWVKTGADGNAVMAGNGTLGAQGVALVPGNTPAAFTETLLENTIDACFIAGGNPDVIMMGAYNKRVLNTFAGSAAVDTSGAYAIREAKDMKIINAVSIYESDYGIMKVVPNRFSSTKEVLVYEKEFWGIAELRGMQTNQLAKTGDSDAKQVIYEATLVAKNPNSSGGVYDCTDA